MRSQTSFTRMLMLSVAGLVIVWTHAVHSSEPGPSVVGIEPTTAPIATELTLADDQTCDILDDESSDRLWMVSTRHLATSVCNANLDQPNLRFHRLSCSGRKVAASLDEYLSTLRSDRPVIVYVHGNRMDEADAIRRGIFVYRDMVRYRCDKRPVDWVIWNWPSEKDGILIQDVREKACRTDTQGLYLAWLLRNHVQASLPTSLIGYSFGGRVITGSLHAMAGGSLGRRSLTGEGVTGAAFDVGMVAPAIENDWLAHNGYHSLATKNMDRLVLLYNQRDAVLKRYWLIDQVRSSVALGFSGPRSFAPRFDGTKLPVRARDCSPTVGIKHDEEDYYNHNCRAGREMATLVGGCLTVTP